MGTALGIGLWTVHRVEKFVRYTIDETLRKVADELSESLSRKIKKIVGAYTNLRGGQGEPGTADITTGSSAPPSMMRTCTSFAPGVSAPSGIMLATTHSSCSR